MICKARYSGDICHGCGAPIQVGQLIDWNARMQSARHADCQTPHQASIAKWDHARDHLWDRREDAPGGQLCAGGCGTRLYGYRRGQAATCLNCLENQRIRELATKLADAMRTGESPTELAQSRDTRDENVASAYDSPETVIEDAQRAHRVLR